MVNSQNSISTNQLPTMGLNTHRVDPQPHGMSAAVLSNASARLGDKDASADMLCRLTC